MSGLLIAVVWSKFLPYHIARVRRLRERLQEAGHRLTAIEVASKDELYVFPDNGQGEKDYVCIFSGSNYRKLNPLKIHTTIYEAIKKIAPDIIFSPSTPFPSGMASIKYALRHGKKSIIMDDAWDRSDRRIWMIKKVKKTIHQSVDGAFIPAPSHASYYLNLGFSEDRLLYSVDVVDNDFYERIAIETRREGDRWRETLKLPHRYFLFVGRFIERKGIDTMLDAYQRYRREQPVNSLSLVLVGDGDESYKRIVRERAIPDVHFVGAKFGEDLARYYGLATAFVFPSVIETWGLVANEAMASHLPIIASDGCGCARTLVEENINGWTFDVGDAAGLAALMTRFSILTENQLVAMGARSKAIIDRWTLDTFADSVLKGIELPRRPRVSIDSHIAIALWPGRISFYP
jgi:glycosyltransferase involved in cell wall biosynthesis